MTTATARTTSWPTRALLQKVPGASALFWLVKVLTTGMGEAAADYLSAALPLAVAGGIGALLLAVTLTLQLRTDRYRPWVYWSAIAAVGVFGTMVADGFRVGLGLSYGESTAVFALGLSAVLLTWWRTERTLSIHSITTRRRELFYWATVMATFALGTAAGDLTARSLHLGYLASGVLFAVAIAVPAIAGLRFGLNPVLAFWAAYVITRPLGASFADWVAVPGSSGLGLGTGPVTLALLVLIAAGVARLAATHRTAPVPPSAV